MKSGARSGWSLARPVDARSSWKHPPEWADRNGVGLILPGDDDLRTCNSTGRVRRPWAPVRPRAAWTSTARWAPTRSSCSPLDRHRRHFGGRATLRNGVYRSAKADEGQECQQRHPLPAVGKDHEFRHERHVNSSLFCPPVDLQTACRKAPTAAKPVAGPWRLFRRRSRCRTGGAVSSGANTSRGVHATLGAITLGGLLVWAGPGCDSEFKDGPPIQPPAAT